MKYLFGIVVCLMAVACSSEGGEDAAATEETTQEQTQPTNTNDLPDLQAAPAAPPGATAHYACPQGCAGGEGGEAGNCPVCGTEMAHNAAFHNQEGGDAAAPVSISGDGAAGEVQYQKVDGPPGGAQGATPEPPQNTAGVWHYTCSAGCAGGAGGAGKCASCGGELAHNQTYHQ